MSVSSSTAPHFHRLAVVGIGLLGGSLALAWRRAGAVDHVIGVARTQRTRDLALECGAADEVTDDVAAAVAQADLIVLSAPVDAIIEHLAIIAEAVPAGALVTDVGSTKRTIAATADRLLADRLRFVGGHPMAGRESGGIEHADPDLYAGAVWVLTPTASTQQDDVAIVTRLARSAGARTVCMAPADHDRIVAATSHLPHFVAVAAVHAVADLVGGDDDVSDLVGPGFRDTTRVAAGSAAMWEAIARDNADHLVRALDAAIEALTRLRREVETDGPLRELLAAASERRRELCGEHYLKSPD